MRVKIACTFLSSGALGVLLIAIDINALMFRWLKSFVESRFAEKMRFERAQKRSIGLYSELYGALNISSRLF